MSEKPISETKPAANGPQGYRISNGPVVRLARTDAKLPPDLANAVELPRVYGAPLLFAIARDPRTIFVYWNVDWSTIFENTAPVDRQVHLRVSRPDGSEESTQAVEPMTGNFYLTVTEPRQTYRVEVGYFQPEAVWHSVATSEQVTMPAERVTGTDDLDLATIPFHLSFQRLIDSFRGSNPDALSKLVSRLQERAVSDEDEALLTEQDWEVLRAMNLSPEKIDEARRAFGARKNANALRRRAEAILGVGGTSPTNGFSESSWT